MVVVAISINQAVSRREIALRESRTNVHVSIARVHSA